ncbi:MAG: N-acetylmuramoyl-L-alanine amidase, partial [bacterium]|nr:N-acetylmuramoyl-L-alanine amidase [bacterium]
EIQRQLVWKTKANDRGVRHARFYVIKNVSCPAVLIETGYLSNAREGSQLQTWRRQRDTVNAIVDGIMRYVSATAPAEKKPKPRKPVPKKPAPKTQSKPVSKVAKAEPEAGHKADRKQEAPLLKPAPKDDGTLLQPVPPLLKPAPKDDGTLLKPVPKREKPSMKMIPKAAPDPGTRAKRRNVGA